MFCFFVKRSPHRHLWHHTQSFLHCVVPRSHKEPCFAVYICVCWGLGGVDWVLPVLNLWWDCHMNATLCLTHLPDYISVLILSINVKVQHFQLRVCYVWLILIPLCVNTHTQTCTHARTHTHKHSQTHTQTHTHTHTHTHKLTHTHIVHTHHCLLSANLCFIWLWIKCGTRRHRQTWVPAF